MDEQISFYQGHIRISRVQIHLNMTISGTARHCSPILFEVELHGRRRRVRRVATSEVNPFHCRPVYLRHPLDEEFNMHAWGRDFIRTSHGRVELQSLLDWQQLLSSMQRERAASSVVMQPVPPPLPWALQRMRLRAPERPPHRLRLLRLQPAPR